MIEVRADQHDPGERRVLSDEVDDEGVIPFRQYAAPPPLVCLSGVDEQARARYTVDAAKQTLRRNRGADVGRNDAVR